MEEQATRGAVVKEQEIEELTAVPKDIGGQSGQAPTTSRRGWWLV